MEQASAYNRWCLTALAALTWIGASTPATAAPGEPRCLEESPLHRAAARGDVIEARQILAREPSLRAEANAVGETPLHVAARVGHVAVLRVLLVGVGDELERTDAWGATPLLGATRAGREAAARLLIAAGARVDAASDGGMTVLHAAAGRGLVGLTPVLLQRLGAGLSAAERRLAVAAALEATDEHGLRPLEHAVIAGAEPIVGLFLRQGAAVVPETLAAACGLSRVKLARTLAGEVDEVAPLDLALEATLSAPGIVAATTVSCLLDAGAHATTAAFRSALEMERRDIAATLLVRATAYADGEDTMLHAAAMAGDVELLGVLLLLGVPVDVLDAEGVSALHRAIESRQAASVRALLEAGADASRPLGGVSPLGRALGTARAELVRALVERVGYDALSAAALDEVDALARVVAEDPAAATRKGPDGLAPIHVAARFGARAAIALLIHRGVSIDDAIAEGARAGWTALDFAAAGGRAALYRWLLRAGAKEGVAADGRSARSRATFTLSELIADADLWELMQEQLSSAEGHDKPPPVMGMRPPQDDWIGEGTVSSVSFIGLGGGLFRVERRLSEEAIPVRTLVDTGVGGLTPSWSRALAKCLGRGHWPEAERLARDLVAEQAPAPLPTEVGGVGWSGRQLLASSALQTLARALIERGRFDEAARELVIAERQLGPVASTEQLTPALRVETAIRSARALLAARQGRLGEAATVLEGALADLAGDAHRALRAGVLGRLAVVLGEAARYGEAIVHARRALEEARQLRTEEAPSPHVLRHNLATLLGRAGARDEARGWVYSELVRVEAGAVDGVEDRAQIRYAAGLWRHVDGQPEEAEALMIRARDELAEAWPEHPALGRFDLGLGLSLTARGDLERASAVFARGEAALFASEEAGAIEALTPPTAVDVARVRAARASILRRQGRHEEALALARAAYAIVVGTEASEARWPIELELARIEAANGHLGAAIFFGKRAVKTLGRMRDDDVPADLRRAFVEDRLQAWRELADHLAEAGRFLEATAALAAIKEDEMQGLATRGSPDDARAATEPMPDVGAERQGAAAERPVIQAQAEVDKQVERVLAKDPGPADLARLEQARRTLRERRRAFETWLQGVEEELGSLSPERARAIAAMNLRDLAGLQGTLADLGEGVVLIHYLMTEDRLRIIVTTRVGQVGREVPIGMRDLNSLVFQFRQVLADAGRSPEAAAHALYQVLIAPIEIDLAESEARTLLVSLDGALRYAPLAALWDGRQWLVERFQVVHFARAALDKIMVGRRDGGLLAAFGCGRAVPGFDKLDAVPAELESIVKRDEADPDGEMPGVVKLDDDFSRDALMGLLEERRFRAIHIASHFVLGPGGEAESYLLLGDGSRLSLADIRFELRFDDVDLLSLSACNTAMGESSGAAGSSPGDGREVEGLASLALRLGARAVLATLWPVNDISTGLFMRTLYRRMHEDPQRSRADALRMAMLAFIRGEVAAPADVTAVTGRARPLTPVATLSAAPAAAPEVAPQIDLKHPRYWAPFVFIGNWR